MSFWNIIDAHGSAYNCFSTEIVNFPLFTDFEGKMRRLCTLEYNGVLRLPGCLTARGLANRLNEETDVRTYSEMLRYSDNCFLRNTVDRCIIRSGIETCIFMVSFFRE